MMNFYKFFFINFIIIGTLISISSMSWLIMWMGLEINLLSIVPLMKKMNNKYSSEAMIKYFIIQTMASSIFLFSIIFYTNMKNISMMTPISTSIFINTALLIKMGSAPFHFWYPEIMNGLSWNMIYIMLTWQKLAPMLLLMYSSFTPIFMTSMIIISSFIGSMQGLNQVCLRKILTYSSMNHTSWMISSIMISMKIWLFYFTTYTIINLNIIQMLNKFNLFYMNQLYKIFPSNKKIKFLFMLNLLSLGGLPPFLGFLPKWLTINFMVMNNYIILTVILTIFTLLTLYFYLRMMFSTLTLNSTESSIFIKLKIKFMNIILWMMSLLSMPMYTTILYLN